MKRLLALLLAGALASGAALAQNAGWPPPAGAVAFLGVYNSVLPTLTNGQVGFVQVDNHGQLLTSVTVSPPANVTPTDCSGTITSGGTAQNAFTAQTALHGFVIANIDTTAELLWMSFTTTASPTSPGSYQLGAATSTSGGQSFTTPYGFGTNHAVSVVAATTGHKFSCTWW